MSWDYHPALLSVSLHKNLMRFTAGGIIISIAIAFSTVVSAQLPPPPGGAPGGPPGGPPIGVRHPFSPPALPPPPPNQSQSTPPGDGERINTVIDRNAPLDA
jgi:hypothetical protein